MKKTFLILFSLLLTVSSAHAGLVYFHMNMQGGNVSAGGETAITITARDEGNQIITAYTGNVTLTAALGDAAFFETGSMASGSFVSGQWTGKMIIKGAANPNTITVTDASGATGTAEKNVIHSAATQFQILTEGQSAAPGTLAGYTGAPIALFTYQPLAVTVTACDVYYNRVTTLAMIPDVRLSLSTPFSVTPTGYVYLSGTPNPGTYVFDIMAKPVPDNSNNFDFTAKNTGSSLQDTVTRSFITQNTFFLWPDINGVTWTASEIPVRAGTNFNVAIKSSHYARQEGENKIYTSWDKPVELKAVMFNNLLQDARQSLPSGLIAMTMGEGTTTVAYSKTDRIRIMPVYDQLYPNNNPGDSYVTKTASEIIQVYAAAPATFTASANRIQLQPGEQAVISVDVFDTYANRVSRTAVNYTITTGYGALSTGTALTSNYDYAVENSGGRAQATYTAPDLSGNSAVVTAQIPGVGSFDIVFELISSRGSGDKKTVKNTPNPFNPETGGTIIGYYLDADSKVKMKLFNVFGALVWSKEFDESSQYAKSGPQEYLWNGKTDGGFTVGMGLYTLKIMVENSSGKYTVERKIAVKK